MTGFCVSGAARLDISFSLRKHYLVASWQLASEFPFLVVAGPQRQRSSSARDTTQHRGGHFYLWPQRPGVQLGGSFVQRVTGRAMALRAPTRIWKGPQNMHARALTRALSHTYRHMSAYLHNTQAPMYTLIHILTRPRPRHLLIFTNIHSCHTYTHTAHTYTHSPAFTYVRTRHPWSRPHLSVPWCQPNLPLLSGSNGLCNMKAFRS